MFCSPLGGTLAGMTKRPTTYSRQRRSKSKSQPTHGLNAKAEALVEAMVWDALGRDKAADKVGISRDYAYRLLRSPEVMRHFNAELDAMRTSGKARLVHRLKTITEQDDNQTAAVAAAKVLIGMDGMGRTPAPVVNVGVAVTPGWVIDCTEALARGTSGQLAGGRAPGWSIDASALSGSKSEEHA